VADFVLDSSVDPGPSPALKVWVAVTALVAAVLGGVGVGAFVAAGLARRRSDPEPAA
jgi:hypothetical protein